METKAHIENDTYKALQDSFLHSGRGRPKSLPKDVTLDNRLLVQLFRLIDENGKPLNTINSWIASLFPDHEDLHLPESHIYNLAASTSAKYMGMDEGDKDAFLCTPVTLDFISNSLCAIGITRKNFLNPPEDPELLPQLTNQCVVDLEHFRKGMCYKQETVLKWISHIGHQEQPQDSRLIKNIMHQYNILRKNGHRNRQAVLDFLQCNLTSAIAAGQEENRPALKLKTKKRKSSFHLSKTMNKKNKRNYPDSDKALTLEVLKNLLKEENLKNEKLNGERTELKAKNESLLVKNKKLKNEIRSTKRTKWRLQQNLITLKHRLKALQFEKNNSAQTIKRNEDELLEKLEKKAKKIKNMKSEKKTLQENFYDISNKFENKCFMHDVNIKSGVNNAYSDNVRQAAMLLQAEAGVAAANIGKVIRIVGKYVFSYEISQSLPSKDTALDISREGLGISKIQAAEKVLSAENVTLHLDGTSRDHNKFLSHQISLDDGTVIYLGFTPLSIEDSANVLDVTISLLRRVSKCYSDLSSEDCDEVFFKILRKITSTMTDRASTMKCFDQKLENFLKSELGQDVKVHFLHCNAHFLLGLSSACDKAFQSFEDGIGEALGRDMDPQFSRFRNEKETCVSRLIRLLCDVLGPRGDQKNGCRDVWKEFCPHSLIPCYKSNRFNCFFEAAAAIVHHYESICSFFTSGVLSDPNLKIKSVTADIQDKRLMSCILSLALFYVKVSNPYWNIITSSSVPYSEFHFFVQKMHSSFLKWSKDPSEIFQPDFFLFDPKFTTCNVFLKSVHAFLQSFDSFNLDLVKSILCTLSEECSLVTIRQLNDFIDGPFSENDPQVSAVLQHCPLTNLIGESSFGDLDFDINRRPNCSTVVRSATHCFKRNRTGNYIDSKSKACKTKLFSSARKLGRELKEEAKCYESEMSIQKKQRMLENQQSIINKNIDMISKHEELLRKLDGVGGICKTGEALDNLILSMQNQKKKKIEITETVKDHIRYFKSKGAKNLNLKGNLEELIQKLKAFLSSSNS